MKKPFKEVITGHMRTIDIKHVVPPYRGEFPYIIIYVGTDKRELGVKADIPFFKVKVTIEEIK